jgi:hypothetical protein
MNRSNSAVITRHISTDGTPAPIAAHGRGRGFGFPGLRLRSPLAIVNRPSRLAGPLAAKTPLFMKHALTLEYATNLVVAVGFCLSGGSQGCEFALMRTGSSPDWNR